MMGRNLDSTKICETEGTGDNHEWWLMERYTPPLRHVSGRAGDFFFGGLRGVGHRPGVQSHGLPVARGKVVVTDQDVC